jgi:hypothetical protein
MLSSSRKASAAQHPFTLLIMRSDLPLRPSVLTRFLGIGLPILLCCATLLHAKDKDLKLIKQLPQRLTEARVKAHKGWDTGVTATMKNASYQYNEVLAAMISDLIKTYYPKDQIPQENITDYLKALYTIHHFKQDTGNPSGESQGTMAGLEVISEVSTELEQTVADMVGAIVSEETDFDLKGWQKKWKKAQE